MYSTVVYNCQSGVYFMYSNILTFGELLISVGPFCTGFHLHNFYEEKCWKVTWYQE